MKPRIVLTVMGAAVAACSPVNPIGPDVTLTSSPSTLVAPPSHVPAAYSGRATAIDAKVKLLFASVTTRLGDTGPLPSTGGSLDAALLTASVPGLLTAGVAQGHTAGGNNDASSSSSIVNTSLAVAGIGITASLLASATDANCFAGHPEMSGSSAIAGLTINGLAVDVTGAPNQTITLLGGLVRVVINEQVLAPNSIDVSALRVTVGGITDVTIAKTHSDITCGS